MPDSHHQAGAAAAAAAGRPVGGSGERQRARSAGKTHQRHPGADGRAAGVRLHLGQLHHAADEDAGPGGLHRPADLAAVRPVEAVGLCGAVAAAQLKFPRETPVAEIERGPSAQMKIVALLDGFGHDCACRVFSQLFTVKNDKNKPLCLPVKRRKTSSHLAHICWC